MPLHHHLCRRLAAWGVFALSACGATAEIEWRGTIVGPQGTTFALTDTASGDSRWVPLGGRFGPHVVESYDGRRQLLVLTQNGTRTELSLVAARVAAGKETSATPGPRGLALAEQLAQRGDTQLQELLHQHRLATGRAEQMRVQLAESERKAKAAPPPADPTSGKNEAAPPTPAQLAADLEVVTQQLTSLTAQIEAIVAARTAPGR